MLNIINIIINVVGKFHYLALGPFRDFSLFLLQIPQMILLTFDGAVNHNNYDRYQKVLGGRYTNPNGCPIKGTFFVSHEYR